MDVDVLAERILLDLKNTFKKDPLIDEFDVLPVRESATNKCPVIHIEHKIALEDWCVKHVYVYAYSKFFEWRKKPYKIDPDILLTWTSALVLINPEIETVWNARKELVCQKLLLPENELKLSELVLSRKPKSSPVYAHRKWMLLEIKKNCSSCILQQIVEHELSLCTRVANLYPNNYYAWSHRSWVLKELCNNCFKAVSEELTQTEQWTSTHVSDHCGFHYRQVLLSQICQASHTKPNPKSAAACPLHATRDAGESCDLQCVTERVNFSKVLKNELIFLSNLQAVYLGHETLWYHRRFLLHQFNRINVIPDTRSRVGSVVEEAIQCKRHKLECDGWDFQEEGVFLDESIKRAKGQEWEESLIKRHVKWLRAVLSWPITLPQT